MLPPRVWPQRLKHTHAHGCESNLLALAVSEEGRWEINKDRQSRIQLVLPVGCVCQVFKSLQIKGGGGVTAVGSTSDVEQCLLESSHNDGWTHKQRYRSKVPSVVTTRVRPCQAVLEEDTDALNDSVHWCMCVGGGGGGWIPPVTWKSSKPKRNEEKWQE